MRESRKQFVMQRCARYGWRQQSMFATALLVGQVWSMAASAQPQPPGNNRANPRVDVSALDLSLSDVTGQVTFISGKNGAAINVSAQPGAAVAEPIDFLRQYGYLFGVRDADTELVETRKHTDGIGFTHTSYEQRYKGVPVFSGVLRVHQNAGGAYTAANGDFYPISDKLPVTPAITADEAVAIAAADLGAGRTQTERSDLVVVDPGWYGDKSLGARLAYHVILNKRDGAISESYFVDGHTGQILDRWDLIHRDLDRNIHNHSGGGNLPGVLVRQEGDDAPLESACEDGLGPGDDPDEAAGGGCPGTGNCCVDNGTPGCSDFSCCNDICEFLDPFCCDSVWDADCALLAQQFCDCEGGGGGCDGASGSCCAANGTPGCNDSSCCDAVCAQDSFCCDNAWDQTCAIIASFLCGQCVPGACCIGNGCAQLGSEDCSLAGGDFQGIGERCEYDDVNAMYDYFGDTYYYFLRAFGRDAQDNAGLSLFAAAYASDGSCPNAYWNGFATPHPLLVFCEGLVADDVVAHEFTHGVTQFTAGLIYQNQSGQLNESYSDVFGELVDLFNGNAAFAGGIDDTIPWFEHPSGPGQDTPNNLRSNACSYDPVYNDGVRWMVGEDVDSPLGLVGALRDMWNPNCFGDPADLNEDNPIFCHPLDNGGVHIGSGVGNHAFAIATDGKVFNGRSVSGVGPIKSGAVWYRALSQYLTPASDYGDAYLALNQAAMDLIGTTPNDPRNGQPSTSMFTAADAQEVDLALLAVEMNTRGTCGAGVFDSVEAPDCTVQMIFEDDFENGVNGWTFDVRSPEPPTPYNWVITGALPAGRLGDAWFCEDRNIGNCGNQDESGAHELYSPQIELTGDEPIYVQFTHWVATETNWDGGNVKIRVNNGAWQSIPVAAFLTNPPNTALFPQTLQGGAFNTNPLGGEEAWTGVGEEWGTTVIDLAGLATTGDDVEFRFDFGKDGCTGFDGWYVDDFQIYTCAPPITDCNGNTIPDECDIDCDPGECISFPGCGQSDDVNGNGVPDECDECINNGDCDDGVACTVDTCNVDVCEYAPDDNACADDGEFCNGEEVCDAVLDCVSSGNPCGAGFECDEDSDKCNCLNDEACTDGLFCNGVDTCDLDTGDCLHPGNPCDPGFVCDEQRNFCACDDNGDCADAYDCTTDICDFNGVCANMPDDNACADDGLHCNGVEVCCPDEDFDFECDPQTDPVTGCASTGDPCVDDGYDCDEALDACVCNDNGDCDDGAYCTGVETCDAGECLSSGNPCQAEGEVCNEALNRCDCATNAYCDDGVFCNGAETCVGGQCQDGTAPCTDAEIPYCNEGLDACVECTLPAHCDDGQFCNGSETCGANGACAPGTAPCPGALCNEIDDLCVQCVGAADCNDGLFCNGVEVCSDGHCASGTAPCAAGQVCNETNDTCDACDSDSDCDDGLFCNGAEVCTSGSCESGAAVCADECCNELTDDCVACQCTSAVDCDDDDPCTTDTCTAGLCGHALVDGCADTDRDGVANLNDQCANSTPGLDVDSDGCACNQRDTDNDGVNDCDDACPGTTGGIAINAAGCACNQLDDDNDGVDNCDDACPDSAPGANVNATGCAAAQRDTDGDGVVDEGDSCAETPFGESVNAAGCSQSQLDTDADGVFNDADRCPGTTAGAIIDEQGCAREQRDDDDDGVLNADDLCALTPAGAAVDDVGCAQSQIDSDRDGVANDVDECPGTPVGQPVDAVGCAVVQVDGDLDGVRDAVDLCPGTPRGAVVDASGCTVEQAVLADIEAGAGVPDDGSGSGSGNSTTRSTGGANNGTCGIVGMFGLLGAFVGLRSLQIIGGGRRRRRMQS